MFDLHQALSYTYSMKVTLKKFSQDPYRLIEKAPITIVINDKPRYIIVPYETYMFNREQVQPSPKKHTKLWKFFFS